MRRLTWSPNSATCFLEKPSIYPRWVRTQVLWIHHWCLSRWQFSLTVVSYEVQYERRGPWVLFSSRCCTPVRRSVERSCLAMPRLERFICFTGFFFLGDIGWCSSGTCWSLTTISVPVGQVSFIRSLSFSARRFGTSYPQKQCISYFGGCLNIVWEPWTSQLYSTV